MKFLAQIVFANLLIVFVAYAEGQTEPARISETMDAPALQHEVARLQADNADLKRRLERIEPVVTFADDQPRIALPGGYLISRPGNDGLYLVGSHGGVVEVVSTPRIRNSSGFWAELQSDGSFTGFKVEGGNERHYWSLHP